MQEEMKRLSQEVQAMLETVEILIFAMSIIYCLIGTVTVRFIKGVKR